MNPRLNPRSNPKLNPTLIRRMIGGEQAVQEPARSPKFHRALHATALSLSILALGVTGMQSAKALGGPLPIKKIGIDQDHQVVIYFGKRDGEFPSPPHLLETPGPNHRITLEFSDAAVDKINMPAPEDLSTKLHKLLPAIKSVRYSTIAVGDMQKARVVIELPEQLAVKPRVVKLEEDSVTIKLGDDIFEQGAGLE